LKIEKLFIGINLLKHISKAPLHRIGLLKLNVYQENYQTITWSNQGAQVEVREKRLIAKIP